MAEVLQGQQEQAYGAKVESKRKNKALATQQPAPAVPLPQQTVGINQVNRPGVTIKNPYQLLPASLNFPQTRTNKTPVEVSYDAGLLFDMLGRESREFKVIADELLNRS